jgi:hypothetical protein
MNQSWLQRRWPAIRARGRWHFVLVRGLLVWGGAMTLVVYAMLTMAARRQDLQLHAVWPLVPLFCLPAGAFWALISWHWNDYLYRKLGFDKSNRPQ